MDITHLIQEAAAGRWDTEKAWAWRKERGWLVGANFLPSDAINQLEMWQAETFNPKLIDTELSWLAALGMNSMRVFLHDLLWKQDAKGFLARIEQFLEIAAGHGIGVMFVFFDSVWNPFPHLGRQRTPELGLHNSYWVQSPGLAVLRDGKATAELEDYVVGVVNHFRNDSRVHAWDAWNEPDNNNGNTYGPRDLEFHQKVALVLPLLIKTFRWIRSAQPRQPVTSAVWRGEWDKDEALEPLMKLQLFASDVISFHRYDTLEMTRRNVEELKRFGRPLICTEYMARGMKSTFESILPYFKEAQVDHPVGERRHAVLS